jgi:hypothetical protein
MTETRKLSVRLTPRQKVLLQARCAATASDASSIVRRALDEYLSLRPIPVQPLDAHASIESAVSAEKHNKGPNSPREPAHNKAAQEHNSESAEALEDLFLRYQLSGLAVNQERLSLFRRLVVVAHLVLERERNPRDETLCIQLVHLGRKFGFL